MMLVRSTRRLWTVLPVAFGLMGWLVPASVSAQSPGTGAPSSTLEALRQQLGPGDEVSIVQATGDSVKGRVLRVGDSDLDIRTDAARIAGEKHRQLNLTIPLSAIQSLERRPDSARNGTLIGMGVGAGVSVGLFIHAYAIDANEMDEWAAGYVLAGCLFTGIGGLVGWAIDVAHSKPHLIYDAPPAAKVTARVVPVVSRRPGIALQVSF